MSSSQPVQVRLKAIQALLPVVQQKSSLSSSLPKAQRGLSQEDSALVQALAFGVCRFYPRLEFWAQLLLERPFKTKDLDVQLLLLIGLYQLQEERVADYAAIDCCVEASKTLNKPWASGLLNACLRRFQREQAQWMQRAEHKEVAASAHPAWLLKRFKKAWPKLWPALCEANNQQPPMTLRINARQTTREAYLALLHQAGFDADPTPFSPWGIRLHQPVHPHALPHFAEGWCSVQDEAAQLAPLLLEPQQGERLLDACCAPGGKTAHLAELVDGPLLALDIDAHRLQRVEENFARLQLSAQIQAADAAQPATWWDGQLFDRILLDAPCSATGVIRRHPDIKLLRRETDLKALAQTQLALLKALWPCLKPGGRLVYATCSVLPEENTHPLSEFTYQHPDAEAVDLSHLTWGEPTRWGRQLLPQAEGTDGFFYACLIKKAV